MSEPHSAIDPLRRERWIVLAMVCLLERDIGLRPALAASAALPFILAAPGWLASYIGFMTNERIVIRSTSPQRMLISTANVAEHSGEAVRLLRQLCDGGKHLTAGVHRCP